jgi:hypothetical protein
MHSVSAVTFVTAVTFLEMQNYTFSGHIRCDDLMEAPAIIIESFWLRFIVKGKIALQKISTLIKHSFTNGVFFR